MTQLPRLSRFPHHAWLGYWEHVPPGSPVVTVCRRQVAFTVGYMDRGHAAVRWLRRGRERRFDVDGGAVRFSPADGERHTFIASHEPGNAYFSLVIPRTQMEELAASEAVDCPGEWHDMLCPADPVLHWCLQRLSAQARPGEDGTGGRRDEAGRRLLLRVLELHGGGGPSWGCDASVFDSHTLDDLVAYIDDHLSPGPRLVDMGAVVGLSPSHFARKFRRSTGLSLHRLVNVRRIQASFPALRANHVSLARLSIDLGFASQSHFTRLFGAHTGMSPAKYRKQLPGVSMAFHAN